MERLLDGALPGLPAGRYHRIRYEDLIAAPVERVSEIYHSTGLSGFDGVRPALQNYVERNAGFQRERIEISGQQIENVSCQWRCMFDKYGYPTQASALDAAA